MKPYYQDDFVTLYHGDCLLVMPTLPASSVDMVLCDLPYGTTSCAWDTVIPFDALWREYRRIAKTNAAIILMAGQPFAAALTMSNISSFRYEWIWTKNMGTGVAFARHQPMRYHESILVFYQSHPTYNPQKRARNSAASINVCRYLNHTGGNKSSHGSLPRITKKYDPETKGPESILAFDCVPNGGGRKLHPTQKPVALMEYLIRTYTNAGDVVLDNCMGSGTTGVACINTGRAFLGIEKDAGYFSIARTRINETNPPLLGDIA